jgi:hypothetical protein
MKETIKIVGHVFCEQRTKSVNFYFEAALRLLLKIEQGTYLEISGKGYMSSVAFDVIRLIRDHSRRFHLPSSRRSHFIFDRQKNK